ncbi:Putative pterin-4-alpha-carbinolamine dehydratase [Baekduia alba]|uniref:4a-hydroxytetrahydrobiopterin dehydratase n=1 Tax=Baekduia alba TaxID=2997333 RepID=UPI0023417B21|nr:4a-hydroxytetrahydrobiopterin dehydratase [Baekduia alba]WCB95767.1 Putative pterin-4-alpha-carbinolamine dehydratase [Baekduia alba]
MADLLTDPDIDARLADLDGWTRDGDAIVRERELADFAAALAWVNAVGQEAEAANHHPDILIHGWNKVRLSVTNHSAGGLTRADFDLAATIDALPGG